MESDIYDEDDYLMLSGLQHFAFCRRQWALIHVENSWAENERTVDGKLFHKAAHDTKKIEKRGELLICRGLKVKSAKLGMSGNCDVVEFHMDEKGVSIFSYEGRWIPVPVEYKKGTYKTQPADEVQLCAQAICLEEMLLCSIPYGYLYYGESRRRTKVIFSEELRDKVHSYAREMHDYWKRGYTPRVRRTKSCNACSLKELCLPMLEKTPSVDSYIQEMVRVTNEL